MLTTTTPPHQACVERVERAVARIARLVLSRLVRRDGLTLVEVVEEAEKLIDEEGWTPCLSPSPDYKAFLSSQLDGLAKTVFNVGMEATARYIERLAFSEYALLSMTVLGYALNTITLVDGFKRSMASMTVEELAYLEPLVFAAVLRYMGVCRMIRDLGVTRLRRLMSRIVVYIDAFSREDSGLAMMVGGGTVGGRAAY